MGFLRSKIRFFICDGASVNKKAVDAIRGEGHGLALYQHSCGIICISHASNIIGAKLLDQAPRAMELLRAWMAVISHSFVAKSLFKSSAFNVKKQTAKTTSETRWYSKYEVIRQMAKLSGAVWEVAMSPQDFSKDSRASLRRLVEVGEEQRALLRLELCAVADIGERLPI